MSTPYKQNFSYSHGPQMQIHGPQKQNINIDINKLSDDKKSNTFYNSDFKKSKIEFNEKPKFQDVWAIYLFLSCVVVSFIIAAVKIPNIDSLNKVNDITGFNDIIDKYGSKYGNYNENKMPTLNEIILLFGISLGSNAILCFFYILLLHKFTGKMIKGNYIFFIIINIVFGLISLFTVLYLGICLLVIAAIFGVIFFFWKKNISFAKVMLKNVISVTKKYPATILIGFFGSIVVVVWYGFIGTTIYCLFPSKASKENNIIGIVISVFLAFSLFYFSHVVKNIIHVTVSGVFATYYFRGVNNSKTNEIEIDVKNPTLKSLKRALTTSFGSICFGSLLISLIDTLKVLAKNGVDSADDSAEPFMQTINCCAKCILHYIGDILEYFNVYAFTEVAVFGKPYCQAAKDTWTLCKANGIKALINDNIIGTVMVFGAICVGYLSAPITIFAGIFVTNNINAIMIFCFISFFSSFLILSVIFRVINSGVATTFVCLCEDPDTLRQTKPDFYDKVKETYPTSNF